MPFLNDYLIGTDPEFAIVREGHLQMTHAGEAHAPWGVDHGGYVVEPHPKPSFSVKELLKNLKTAMNDFALTAPEGVWKAEAAMQFPERWVTLGGHVHIDKPKYTLPQVGALDRFTNHLEKLDIFPGETCKTRRAHGYGRLTDVRAEHGRFEYRSFPSWLFSQRVAKVALIGAKLSVSHPLEVSEALGTPMTASVGTLKKTFELFRGKDEDVDWILDANLFDKKLNVRSDRDLRTVWKVTPEKEDPRWKEQEYLKKREALKLARETTGVQDIQFGTVVGTNTNTATYDAETVGEINEFHMVHQHTEYRVSLIYPATREQIYQFRRRLREAIDEGEVVLWRTNWQTCAGIRFRIV